MQKTKTSPNVKTISIGAIPQWETKTNLKPYLAEDSLDRQRISRYPEAKALLDTYARYVIGQATQAVADLSMEPTYKALKTLCLAPQDKTVREKYRRVSTDYKRVVAGTIKKTATEYQLTGEPGKLFDPKKSAIYKNASLLSLKQEDFEVLALYQGFTSYFSRYFTSLVDVILCGTEKISIASRILENMETYWKNEEILRSYAEQHPALYATVKGSADTMELTMCMTQKGVDAYNLLLGNTDHTGINSLVGQYADRERTRTRFLKRLNKIPLTEAGKQFTYGTIQNEEELRQAVAESIPLAEKILAFAATWKGLSHGKDVKDTTYIPERYLNRISFPMYKSPNQIAYALRQVERSDKEKENKLVSVSHLEEAISLIEEEPLTNLDGIIKDHLKEAEKSVRMTDTIRRLCDSEKPLKPQRKQIKTYYDGILHVRQAASLFDTTELENTFVEDLAAMQDTFWEFNTLYNKVRNYCTKNPISKTSYEMFFTNGSFLSSFDVEKWRNGTSMSSLLRKDGMYYLYVLNPAVSRKVSDPAAYVEEGGYDRLVYKQITGLNKMFPKCFVYSSKAEELYGTTPAIRDIVENKRYTKEAGDREAVVEWIRFCISAFQKNPEWSAYYNVPFKEPEAYESANEFYTTTEKYTTYMGWSEHLDEAYVRKSVADGSAFLFQLYNRDFSPYHTGKDSNYTRILKELFSEKNMEKVNNTEETALKLLSGGATLTFRPASIPYKETHKAGDVLKNKNPLNPKPESTFDYAICKDRRFMFDRFILRIGVQFGYRNEEVQVYDLNRTVNASVLREKPNILTVRAGEEHLLYYMVTDPENHILEQGSLNAFSYTRGGMEVWNDYKAILSKREEEMAAAKEDWDYSVDIKDVRNGYVSCALHKVLEIRDQYDAVIFLEDYSSTFADRRRANIKAVYAQFQAALLNKLSCYVPEGVSCSDAVQMTPPAASSEDLKGQKGVVYFVNPAYTSNADYTSGFCNLFRDAFRYENMKKSAEVCDKLDVVFDDKAKEFQVVIKERDFGFDSDRQWTLHTRGERSLMENRKLAVFDCNEHLADLFRDYHISEFKEHREAADKAFYERFFRIMYVLLQMHYGNPQDGSGYFLSPVTGHDTRTGQTAQPDNSTAVKTFTILLKGSRDLDNINEETLFITRDAKGKYVDNWLSYLQEQSK